MSDRETLVQWFDRWWATTSRAERQSARTRMEQADAEYAELRTQVEEARQAHGEACADRDTLSDERERLLRLMSNAEQKLAAIAADKDALRKEHYALAARCGQKTEYIDALTADKEALRQERGKVLAELDGVRKERDQLRESLAWANDQRANLRGAYERSLKQCAALNDALEAERLALRVNVPNQGCVCAHSEPSQLEIAARVVGGMSCEVPWDDDRVLHECADAAWRMAGELLAKAAAPAPGAGKDGA